MIRSVSFFWGLPPSAAGPLQGSQVCSALQPFGLWSGLRPPFQAPRPAGLRPCKTEKSGS
ncbi:hypothetical protein SGRA_1987 [Saprospira grandis str. Lewin]|uniref:Uncharacterized protein n=1 Tax=Saprospira grandis (strain Lewin) TaxID=984262 RepID=H6L280_SAPGL|nr:hypothetical protein SGRA_1987 [Saprospira grandis str. Lewin]